MDFKSKVFERESRKKHCSNYSNSAHLIDVIGAYFVGSKSFCSSGDRLTYYFYFFLMGKARLDQASIPVDWNTFDKYLVNPHVLLFVYFQKSGICSKLSISNFSFYDGYYNVMFRNHKLNNEIYNKKSKLKVNGETRVPFSSFYFLS